MMIVNRFVGIAERFSDHAIPLDQVFCDAERDESNDIIEAMYVIANRRLKGGCPIDITELTDSIPLIVENDAIRDAAIEISIQGLTASGHSHDKALEVILDATTESELKSKIIESKNIDVIIRESITEYRQGAIELPCQFGRQGYDEQARYELRRILGSGNQGTVYEAVDRVFQEEGMPSLVALKIFHSDSDPDRSRKEGARARRVRHKNIARAIDQGVSEDGKSYVTYELIEGQSLDAWVKQSRSPVTTQDACRVVIDLAKAVQCAHASGVIHRDIKPTNILMTRDGDPVITDFGIAHAVSSDPKLCSHYGTRGSLAFMAPEQFDQSADGSMPSVDVYALGGILFWLLAKKFPNGDSVSEALTWLEQRNEGGPKRVHEWQIDPQLQSILMRALAVESSQRYQSPEMFAQDIEDYLSHRPVLWMNDSVVRKTKLFAQRNPLVVMAYGLVVVSLALGAGVWVDSKADMRFERARAESILNVERLNAQVILEQDRVEQVKAKASLVKMMISAWANSVDSSADEDTTSYNLLFLHMVSTTGMLDDDPEYADKIINRKIEVAEEFISSVDWAQTSPIQQALWHEMIGVWYSDKNDLKCKSHLLIASSLVIEHAPTDTIWLERISSKMKLTE